MENITCEHFDFGEFFETPKTIFKFTLALLILVANTVLITVILKSPKLRRQRFHKYIISLAFADILIGLTIPLMTLTGEEQMWHLGPALCQLFTSLQKLSLAVSTNHFLGISLDRMFAIRKPVAYRWPPDPQPPGTSSRATPTSGGRWRRAGRRAPWWPSPCGPTRRTTTGGPRTGPGASASSPTTT